MAGGRWRDEEKRRSWYHLHILNLGRAVLLGLAVAVAGAALGNTALAVVGAVLVLVAVIRGVAVRRRYRSGR